MHIPMSSVSRSIKNLFPSINIIRLNPKHHMKKKDATNGNNKTRSFSCHKERKKTTSLKRFFVSSNSFKQHAPRDINVTSNAFLSDNSMIGNDFIMSDDAMTADEMHDANILKKTKLAKLKGKDKKERNHAAHLIGKYKKDSSIKNAIKPAMKQIEAKAKKRQEMSNSYAKLSQKRCLKYSQILKRQMENRQESYMLPSMKHHIDHLGDANNYRRDNAEESIIRTLTSIGFPALKSAWLQERANDMQAVGWAETKQCRLHDIEMAGEGRIAV